MALADITGREYGPVPYRLDPEKVADFIDATDYKGTPTGLIAYFTGEDPAEEQLDAFDAIAHQERDVIARRRTEFVAQERGESGASIDELGEPLLSSTLILPGDDTPLMDPYDMKDTLGHAVDLIIDGGYCGYEPTSVVDLNEDPPQVRRVGKGDVSLFEG